MYLDDVQLEDTILTHLPDVRWACGFTGSNGLLVLTGGQKHFVTDGRYREQAGREVRGATIHVAKGDLLRHVAEAGLLDEARRMAFQAEHVSYAQYQELAERFPHVEWVPAKELLVRAVAAKADDEVAAIRRAQRVTEAVFEHVLDVLRPGVTEREVAAEIVYQHLARGAERMAFEPIVAAGPNGALPHARPTDRRIAPGDVVVLDFGCVVDGYASDMTRTVAVGEPPEEAHAVYRVVLAAQEAALAAARAGIASRDLDASARSVIEAAGYGEHFSHGLGHGVGLQTHEWPRVSYQVDYDLPEHAVVTIEPGVYLPGRFGVRIEDMVLLRPGGCDNLTRAPKDFLLL